MMYTFSCRVPAIPLRRRHIQSPSSQTCCCHRRETLKLCARLRPPNKSEPGVAGVDALQSSAVNQAYFKQKRYDFSVLSITPNEDPCQGLYSWVQEIPEVRGLNKGRL